MTGSVSTSPEAPRPVPCGRTVRGRLAPPPSKSLTHRYFNLALLSGRALAVERPLDAEDTRRFVAALTALGRPVIETPGTVAVGPAPAGPPAAEPVEIFCGAAGTLFRFLVASLATLPGRFRLDGVPRLRERPIAPLVDALRALGARIEYLAREGYAPLAVEGPSLAGGRVRLDAGASSQYLSALLMAGQAAGGEVEIEVGALTSEPYVELTLQALAELGGTVERPAPGRFRTRPSPLAAVDRVKVEADFSAGCYPAAAAALAGGEVTLLGLSAASRQGDRGFFDLLAAMGARVSWGTGEVTVAAPPEGRLEALAADLGAMPDQVPTLAALAPFARGTTAISGVPHLRLKESDRLAAMAAELGRLGAAVTELPAGLVVPGTWAGAAPPADPVVVDPHGDHRIAMSLALAGLRRPGVSVADPGVVAKSYPGFWDDLLGLLGT